MIPIRKKGKAGHIQVSTKDFEATERYLVAKARDIASRQQVYNNVSETVKVSKIIKKRKGKIYLPENENN